MNAHAQHAWFRADLSALRHGVSAANAAALGVHIVRRLRGFAQTSHIKRLALKAMACMLTEDDVYRLRVRRGCAPCVRLACVSRVASRQCGQRVSRRTRVGLFAACAGIRDTNASKPKERARTR
jgi:hypothetical protein